jgi:hypothetical protein
MVVERAREQGRVRMVTAGSGVEPDDERAADDGAEERSADDYQCHVANLGEA